MRTLLKLGCALALVIPAIAGAHGPSRQKVVEQIEVAAAPDKVWALVADLCGVKTWNPAVRECSADGGNELNTKRVLTMQNGEPMNDQIVEYDPGNRTYSWMLLEANIKAMPINTLGATIAVTPGGAGSVVELKGAFYRGFGGNQPPPELSDEAAIDAVTKMFQASLARIKELAERP
ncbi:MAG: SRPBCC family protein [Gammaproteobacteria bacterium]